MECGAHAVNYVKAESFLYDENGRINGVTCREQTTGKTFTIYAKKLSMRQGHGSIYYVKKTAHTSEKIALNKRGAHCR